MQKFTFNIRLNKNIMLYIVKYEEHSYLTHIVVKNRVYDRFKQLNDDRLVAFNATFPKNTYELNVCNIYQKFDKINIIIRLN